MLCCIWAIYFENSCSSSITSSGFLFHWVVQSVAPEGSSANSCSNTICSIAQGKWKRIIFMHYKRVTIWVTLQLKSSEFEKKTNNLKTLDSVVYLCHGVANTFSISNLSTVHLVWQKTFPHNFWHQFFFIVFTKGNKNWGVPSPRM